MAKCCICGRYSGEEVANRMHSFPKDPKLSDKWATNIGCAKIINASPVIRNKKYHVCSYHFERTMFSNQLFGTRLKPGSAPTLITTGVPPRKVIRGGKKNYLSFFESFDDELPLPSRPLTPVPLNDDFIEYELPLIPLEQEMAEIVLEPTVHDNSIAIIPVSDLGEKTSENEEHCYCKSLSETSTTQLPASTLRKLKFQQEIEELKEKLFTTTTTKEVNARLV